MNTEQTIGRAKQWLKAGFDEKTKKAVQQLIDENGTELSECFSQDLEFGTGGMRGIMGVGTNRINEYTLGMATQGLSNYIKKSFPDEAIRVAIAHDSRNNSLEYARKIAEIFAANGFEAYLFDSLRPTPELSFILRKYKCKSGVVITASHNPPEYNGYKVYWDDGGQLVPPHDKNVIDEVRKITSPLQVKTDYRSYNIIQLGKDADKMYWESIASVCSEQHDSELKVVFTPLHGTGVKAVPQVLQMLGYQHINVLEEQKIPDGNFPTVTSPNPEEAAALKLAIDRAKQLDYDIVLGTDPDADRVGIAVRGNDGDFVLFNGNQTAAILFNHMLSKWKNADMLDGNQFVCKTIVTSELMADIAKFYGVKSYDTLTGFKWIAELIRKKEGKEKFIVGGEESYGYLIDDFVRDKDAVISSVVICEAASEAKKKGKTLIDVLSEIYVNVGFYKERLVSITKKGLSGAADIKKMMDDLRSNTPMELAGLKAVTLNDYQSRESKNLLTGKITGIDLPKSNVIQLVLEDGSRFTARPSGTEPKIKFYFSVKGSMKQQNDLATTDKAAETKIDALIEALKLND
ncbi:MAG: phospho-sugar mutase [Flavobacteriales bacterium]|nr:phospho-sugar mutase [Flavobacteriales bacterium]